MRRGRWLIAGCSVAVVLGTAFHSRSQSGSAVPVPAVVTVSIRNLQFVPATVEIKKGDVVEWKNDDLVAHTVTSSPVFDSGALTPGQSWRRTFTEADTYPYICTYHPQMKGVVTVK